MTSRVFISLIAVLGFLGGVADAGPHVNILIAWDGDPGGGGGGCGDYNPFTGCNGGTGKQEYFFSDPPPAMAALNNQSPYRYWAFKEGGSYVAPTAVKYWSYVGIVGITPTGLAILNPVTGAYEVEPVSFPGLTADLVDVSVPSDLSRKLYLLTEDGEISSYDIDTGRRVVLHASGWTAKADRLAVKDGATALVVTVEQDGNYHPNIIDLPSGQRDLLPQHFGSDFAGGMVYYLSAGCVWDPPEWWCGGSSNMRGSGDPKFTAVMTDGTVIAIDPIQHETFPLGPSITQGEPVKASVIAPQDGELIATVVTSSGRVIGAKLNEFSIGSSAEISELSGKMGNVKFLQSLGPVPPTEIISVGNNDGNAGEPATVVHYAPDGTYLPNRRAYYLSNGARTKSGARVISARFPHEARFELGVKMNVISNWDPNMDEDGFETVKVLSGFFKYADEDPFQWDELAPYSAKGGVTMAAGDFDGDGWDELVTGPGPSPVFGPHVRGFYVEELPPVGSAMFEFKPGASYFSYGTLKFGVNVAAGDVDGDGLAEILTGAGEGAVFGPHCRGWEWNGRTGGSVKPMAKINFFAFGTLKWGLRVFAADANGDGIDDILASPGNGLNFAQQVRVFSLASGGLQQIPGMNYITGVNSAGANPTAFDRDGDGSAEIVLGPGRHPNMQTSVTTIDTSGNGSEMFYAFPPNFYFGDLPHAYVDGWPTP